MIITIISEPQMTRSKDCLSFWNVWIILIDS